ncbi:MAG: heme exporter protein CcmB [Chloroflexi bacterium]|nr:heme exporter protein CcmB [Chloroflexota bacterium]
MNWRTSSRTSRVAEGAVATPTRAATEKKAPAFAKQLRALIWKEALVELRARETVLAGAVFALLVLVIFNFAFDLRVENVAEVAPGVLWVTVTFAGVLSLGRAFARERDRRTLDGLLLAPVDRSALYLAKVAASVASMLVVEVLAVPAFIGLFNVRVELPLLVLGLLLGTLGLAGVGTLFAAIAAHTRAREVLLPLLLFPIQVPVILATVKTTGAAIQIPGVEPPEIGQWLGLLVAFDAIFLSLSVLLFEYAIEEQ